MWYVTKERNPDMETGMRAGVQVRPVSRVLP